MFRPLRFLNSAILNIIFQFFFNFEEGNFSSFFVFNSLLQTSHPTPAICVFICKNCNMRFICKYMGNFISPEKLEFNPTLCKRINRTSTTVGIWVTAFEERRRTTFSATKFIYNNNNNKQGFRPNGTNNEYVRVHKRVQDSDRW